MGIFTTYGIPEESLKPSAPYKLEPKDEEKEQPTEELKKQVEKLKNKEEIESFIKKGEEVLKALKKELGE